MERTRTDMQGMASLILRGTEPDEAVPLAWPLVCGRRVADRTRALAFHQGELSVQVPDASWREELTGYLPHYLHQLKTLTGVAVARVRFVLQK
jgi:Dna[CI] antecedent, DciA